MVTTLLTQEDGGENRVVGAMGFCLDSEEPVVVLAKATIMCAGAGASALSACGILLATPSRSDPPRAVPMCTLPQGLSWVESPTC